MSNPKITVLPAVELSGGKTPTLVAASEPNAGALPFMTTVAGHVLIHEPLEGRVLPGDWTGLCVDAGDTSSFWYIGFEAGERSLTRLDARTVATALQQVASLSGASSANGANCIEPGKG
ncbi:hypothetical protein ACI2UK_13930 [Ralstonia nicotianae]|uniref:hypothetical protein n=1 Tax=Ralstonia pseudosolanacearum TaxID=1310165 RepID=UPI002003D705|nr:hypothetical protein [Ralstonia pseudosolanacearum]MCK4118357.1 hypothetical protein [Ralstonia pseudosolanacearum]